MRTWSWDKAYQVQSPGPDYWSPGGMLSLGRPEWADVNENGVLPPVNTIEFCMPCESFVGPWEQVGRTPRQTEIGLNWLRF